MSLAAQVVDGKLVYNATQTTSTGNTNVKSTKKNPNALGKDEFLQLLTAEMKYQDPLEPTSNTEWISQYATFAGIEKQDTMVTSLRQMEASSLVGKEVIMKSQNDQTGETKFFNGVVDYMYVEGNDVYLSINEKLYNIKDLDSVVNQEYMDAVSKSNDFKAMMDKISTAGFSNSDETLLKQARSAYEAMNDYEKQFVDKDALAKLQELEAKLKKMAEDNPDDNSEDDSKN